MTADPLDVLRGPEPLVTPDPAFVRRLREDLLARAARGQGGQPTNLSVEPVGPSESPSEPVEIDMDATLLPARRRPLLIGAVAAAALLVGITVVAAGVGGGDGSTDRPGSTTTPRERATPISSVATVTTPAGPAPWAMTAAGGSLWVVNSPGTELERRSPETGALLATLSMPFDIYADAPSADQDSLWVATEADGKVRRIDLASGQLTATVDIPDGIKPVSGDESPGIAVDERGAWVLSGGIERTLTLVDRTTNTATSRFPVTAPHPADLVAGFGSLWITGGDRQLHRVDPTDGRDIASIPLVSATGLLAIGDDAVWVLGPDQSAGTSLQRINPATNTVDATIPISTKRPEIADVTVGNGYVWIRATPDDARLVKIDAATNQIVARYTGLAGGEGIASVDGAIWTLSAADRTLYRIPATSP